MKPVTLLAVLLAAGMSLPACQQQEPTEKTADVATPQAREMAAGPAKTGLPEGQLVYQDACASCHETGIQGAPITGRSDAWADLLIKGPEKLVQNTLQGIGNMPPRGGVPGLSDAEIAAAVKYMIDRVH